MEKGINVLSLFDGMSCGRIALERAGIKVNRYFASEIDLYAIKVSKQNYPDIFRLGDVTKINVIYDPKTDMTYIYYEDGMFSFKGKFDLIIGGSPCQGFSFAGKQLNFEDPRSKLFFEFVRLLKELKISNPDVKFLLENVNMKQMYQELISEYLEVNPKPINSELMSAQTRQRLYWSNIQGIDTPINRNILLCDILENGIVDREKSYCIDANYFKGGNLRQYFEKSRRQIVFEKIGVAKNGKGIYLNGVKDAPFTFCETRTEKGKQARRNARISGLKDTTPRDKESKMYVPRAVDKANCLVTVDSFMNYVLDKNYEIRKLTPIECERLQTVPDNYTACVSNSQRYKMLGNGWTVDVIAHIFKSLKKEITLKSIL